MYKLINQLFATFYRQGDKSFPGAWVLINVILIPQEL